MNKKIKNILIPIIHYSSTRAGALSECSHVKITDKTSHIFFIYHNRGTTCIFYHGLRREKEKPAVDFKRREKRTVNE